MVCLHFQLKHLKVCLLAKMLLFIQFKSFPAVTKLLSIRDLFIKWVEKQLCLIFLLDAGTV